MRYKDKDYQKKYHIKNKDKIKKQNKEYRDKTKDKKREYDKIYHENNKEKKKLYREINRDKIKKQRDEYCEKNRDLLNNKSKDYNKNNPEKIKQRSKSDKYKKYSKEYNKKNKDKANERAKRRRSNDIDYKVRCNLRHRVSQAVKNNQKKGSTLRLLGCSITEFKKHLESMFTEGMNWDNYGKWHIDHIIPCSIFDLKNIEAQKICFNYKNSQPMWEIDNKTKLNKIDIETLKKLDVNILKEKYKKILK